MIEKIELAGNNPQPRFGHTITYISKGKAILFGGATGDTGRYSITGDCFSFDIATRIWTKIEATGSPPSPRAAHASAAVEVNQLVVYGGATGGGSLASDDIYLLDLRSNDDSALWTVVPVIGVTPGRRYGHSLTYSRPFLIVFGGNTGQETVNDFWCLNVEKSPFSWIKIEPRQDIPVTRTYHSASLCQSGSANGMIVIFGGRSGNQEAMNDTWGLRRHRDGTWDWIQAPYKQNQEKPIGRYQHSSLFIGSAMVIIGGRTNNVAEQLQMEIYDTENSEWYRYQYLQRFRHACWVVESSLYIYGGFEQEQPNVPTDSLCRLNLIQLFQNNEHLLKKVNQNQQMSPSNSFKSGTNPGNLTPQMQGQQNSSNKQNSQSFSNKNDGKMSIEKSEKMFKIANEVVIVEEHKNRNDIQYKQVQYENDGQRKVIKTQNENSLHNYFINTLLQPKNYINLPEQSNFMFKPEHIKALCDQCEKILEEQPIVLKIKAPIKIFGDIHGQYSDLMRFFDLWGSPCDNMKDGDIESFDYLFLGDFVDRGNHSLETICLLLALKVQYPEQIHLLRGNHEDKWINNGFGFSEECAHRLDEDPNDEDSVFNRVNRLFEYLPLAAIIEDKIICLHGGIGSSLNYIEEMETLQRPLEVIHEVSTLEQQLVVDILWSDPTDDDQQTGIHANTIRDPAGTGNIVKFGPDRVQQFLQNNNLSMIIRAHECVMDGFERFAGGQLITLFSATDYCGKHKNAGAVLILKTNLEIIPKLIYPNSGQNNWMEDEEALKKRPPTPPRWKNSLPRKTSYE